MRDYMNSEGKSIIFLSHVNPRVNACTLNVIHIKNYPKLYISNFFSE